jgi:hypothetical protein
MLDTDVMVDFLRGLPACIEWLGSLGEEELLLPGLVYLELVNGSENMRGALKLEKALAGFPVCWPTPADAERIRS